MEKHLSIEGMHCDACARTIRRAFERQGVAVERIDYRTGNATVRFEGDKLDAIRQALRQHGYSLRERRATGAVMAAKAANAVERTILADSLLVLGILLVVQALLTLGIYRGFPDYSPRYLPILLYLPFVLVTNLAAIWHQRAYLRQVSCMTGMMFGMTIGMTTGFLVGALVGLTNGMFTGSLVGMAAGIAAGAYAGRCCGTMGVMEGMMAGLMSGTMGAMLTVMMVGDHVEWFLVILLAVCVAILIGMMRITFEETRTVQVKTNPWPMQNVLSLSFIVMLLISLIIMLAPKGAY